MSDKLELSVDALKAVDKLMFDRCQFLEDSEHFDGHPIDAIGELLGLDVDEILPFLEEYSEEIIMMARPCAARSTIRLWISDFEPTSTPCVGSSRMIT